MAPKRVLGWLDFSFDPWESKVARYYGHPLRDRGRDGTGYCNSAAGTEVVGKMTLLRSYLRDNFVTQQLYNQVWHSGHRLCYMTFLPPNSGKTLKAAMREAARRRWLEPVLARHIHSEGWHPAGDGVGRLRHGTDITRAPKPLVLPQRLDDRQGSRLAPDDRKPLGNGERFPSIRNAIQNLMSACSWRTPPRPIQCSP